MQKSFLLGVSVGESFAEYTLLSDSQPVAQKRAYLARESLKTSLMDFVSSHPECQPQKAFVSLRLPRRLLDFNMSGAVAHVTTDGFENWLNISSLGTRHLTNRELLFSLRERTLASGEIELPVSLEELDGIAEKIKLLGLKKVCLHFLHSAINPRNLEIASQFLQDKGLKVFAPSTAETPDEVRRWNKNALSATISGVFAERQQEIREALAETLSPDCVHFLDSTGKIFQQNDNQVVSSLFSASTALGLHLSGTEKADILYLGLESFLLISGTEWCKTWNSSWGPVNIPHLHTKELSIQPTSGITLNIFGRFDFSEHSEGWEPGPMFLGRGQKLSLIDLWAENSKFAKIQGLEERITPQGIQRFKNSFFALSKMGRANNNEVAHLIKEMHSLAMQRIAIEAILHRQRKKMIVTGPLAPVFANVFKKDPYTVVHTQDFSESQATALWGAKVLQESR